MCCQFCGAQACVVAAPVEDEVSLFRMDTVCCYEQDQHQAYLDEMGLNDDEHLERLAAEAVM